METAKRIHLNRTVIDYSSREKLGINITEYCVADLIHTAASSPSNVIGGWASLDGKRVIVIAKALGLSRATTYRALQKLKAKKIIEFHEDNRTLVRATSLWFNITLGQLSQIETVFSKEKVTPKENIYNTLVSNETRDESTKKSTSCPLKNPSNPLKSKYPKGHVECVEYINSFKFGNKGKQFRFLHQMLRIGIDFPDIDKIITRLEKKPYYQENGYDFATIAGEADRRANAS